MNLAQYPLAAQRVLDAIRLQQADATEGYAAGTAGKAAKGVTSDALWNSLRNACLQYVQSLRSDKHRKQANRDIAYCHAD
jgi:peroxin-5